MGGYGYFLEPHNIHSCLKMSMFEEIRLHDSTNCLLKAYEDLP